MSSIYLRGLFYVLLFLIFSCSKEKKDSNTLSNKSNLKVSEVTYNLPKSLEEYLLLENYVLHNTNITKEQFVKYGSLLVFINNQMVGYRNSDYVNFLSPEQFLKLNTLVFKAKIVFKADNMNDFFVKVNKISIEIDLDKVVCCDKENPWKNCDKHVEAQCCSLFPIYQKYSNEF
jgi:hypothetical protein